MARKQDRATAGPSRSRLAIGIVGALLLLAAGFALGQGLVRRSGSVPRPLAEAGTTVAPTTGAPSGGPAAVSGEEAVQAAATAGIGARGVPLSAEDVPVEAGQPRLWVAEVSAENDFTYDLGEIPANQVTEREFTLQNIGQGLLVIEGVDATCGCSAAAVGNDRLQPGETTTVRVSYDPRTYGEQGMKITKSFLIRSNDPLVPLAEVKITAQVANE